MASQTLLMVLLLLTFCSCFDKFTLTLANQTHQLGKWKLLKRSIGISAMHMALLPNDRVIMFDRTNSGPSNITLPNQNCPNHPSHSQTSHNCYAHSVEFNPLNHSIRPLTLLTDTWCSSGALLQNGELIQSGGYKLGERVVRYLKPCGYQCDWEEDSNGLISPRWYASNQILPNGNIIVIGGRFQFSYEFIPKNSVFYQKQFQLPFLEETRDSPKVPNNLYPFVHLSPDGNLFIFANDRAILLDYVNNIVVKKYSVLPGGVSRNYPSTGSSVLLPLYLSNSSIIPNAVVLVCGGTNPDANTKADTGIFVHASKTCGRLMITDENPKWEMEEMPMGRIMGDMILLPTGDVLIINGAAKGSAGWGVAREPVLNPVLYKHNHKPTTSRFEVLSPTKIPRLYHSTAHLLSDGRVLVGGSNPNENYNFSAIFPTELSIEAFSPPYLNKSRPLISEIMPRVEIKYRQEIRVKFHYSENNIMKINMDKIYVTMVAPSFTTHSFAMNQRVLVLKIKGKVVKRHKSETESSSEYAIECNTPATPTLAPPGYYLLFVVHHNVPSRGVWVHIK